MVSLRENPAVAARDVGELDDRTPRVAIAGNPRRTERCLQRDAVHDPPPRPSARAVVPFAPSAPTTTSAVDGLAVDSDRVAELDLDTFANLDAPAARRVEQERVEAPPLRHTDDRARARRTTESP